MTINIQYNFDDIKSLIEKIQTMGHNAETGHPANEQSIIILEENIGYKLPIDYRRFLSTYGSIMIYDSVISGIYDNDPLDESGGNIYYDTLSLKGVFNNIRDGFIVIMKHEDGAYCIDLSSDSENIYNVEMFGINKVECGFNKFIIDWLLIPTVNSNP
jgi:hypothetical protein